MDKDLINLIGVETYKYICENCKRHFITMPKYEELNRDFCRKCSCTSFIIKEGRPIKRKSFKFSIVLQDIENTVELLDLYKDIFIWRKSG